MVKLGLRALGLNNSIENPDFGGVGGEAREVMREGTHNKRKEIKQDHRK